MRSVASSKKRCQGALRSDSGMLRRINILYEDYRKVTHKGRVYFVPWRVVLEQPDIDLKVTARVRELEIDPDLASDSFK